MASKYTTVKRDNKTIRNFSYSKGKVSLEFNLRVDIKQELKDFLEILKVAQEEVKEELTKI